MPAAPRVTRGAVDGFSPQRASALWIGDTLKHLRHLAKKNAD